MGSTPSPLSTSWLIRFLVIWIVILYSVLTGFLLIGWIVLGYHDLETPASASIGAIQVAAGAVLGFIASELHKLGEEP